MPFVNAKCPNCGGTLQADNGKRAAICPFCKEAYIVEDAINSFTTNNYTTIEHLHADVVNYNATPDFDIRAGELIKYNGSATEVIIPNTVKTIGGTFNDRGDRFYGAFQDCTLLKRVVIPPSVNTIRGKEYSIWPGGAFLGCHSLEEVVFPETLKEIGECAFYDCSSLKTVRLPRSVKIIEKRAFERCSSLESISLPADAKLGFCAFYACHSLKHVALPDGVALGGSVFGYCSNLESASFGSGITGVKFSDDGSFELQNFNETAWEEKYKKKQVEINRQKQAEEDALLMRRMRANQCLYCGGEFGLFSKTCKNCGKKKSY